MLADCGVVVRRNCTREVMSAYHLLDVAVHGVVDDCDLGRHLEGIELGVQLGGINKNN